MTWDSVNTGFHVRNVCHGIKAELGVLSVLRCGLSVHFVQQLKFEQTLLSNEGSFQNFVQPKCKKKFQLNKRLRTVSVQLLLIALK
jgi:hypothetical protein